MTKRISENSFNLINHKNTNFTFIDLFAGIGGFHQAFNELGGKCVFASEIDVHSRKTYEYNFKEQSPEMFENGLFNQDIKSIMPEEIPDFDILCAGFPCQPFSQAGLKQGFEDTAKSERGNLFFDIEDIIKAKRPKAFFLENVRGLINHDNGNTFRIIQETLTKKLGYSFYYQVVKASDYGLPQLRPRTFMIGFRDEDFFQSFRFPNKVPLRFNMSDVWNGECSREIGFTLRVGGRGSNINDRRNWDSYLVNNEVKRLSFKEAKIMQGFPESYHFPVSATQAMKQLGNSVAIDAVRAVGNNLINYMNTLQPKETELKKTKKNEGFGIKSYLGAKPTLLNASGNTNFLFQVNDLASKHIENINAISSSSKIKDRINSIKENGGVLKYLKAEKDTMNYNLKMADSLMPEIIGYLLVAFYEHRISKVTDIVDYLCNETNILKELNIDDKQMLQNKIKKFLVDVLLGFFVGTKWSGEYESNGTIVVKNSGSLVAFHIIDMVSLKDYLYESIKLDTPSSTRHKFGTIIQGTSKELFFKLNLQLRF